MRRLLLFLIFGSGLLTPIDYSIPHTTSWIANSFPGGKSPQGWVQIDIADIYVRPDGAVYTNSIWDESGREGGIYKDGKVAGRLQDLHFRGGWAITANARHLFVAMIDFRSSNGRHKIRKYRFDGTPVADAVVNGETDPLKPVPGIAANDTEVFVADPPSNRIKVYDANKLKPIRELEFKAPGKMTLDGAGGLWVIRTSTNNIVRISARSGSQLGEITGLGLPSALAIDNRGNLMVGDSGPNQQIYFYDLQGRRLSSFGVPGGILSGSPGEIGPLKLISPIGVGMDLSGNIYVASRMGGADIRKYTPKRSLEWELMGLAFVDTAVQDPATGGVDVYTKRSHFKMDYSKPPGREWSWRGMTVDAVRYPNDPRIMIPAVNLQPTALAVRTIAGKKFLYLTDQYSNALYVYRFHGETAVPSGVLCPSEYAFFAADIPTPSKGHFLWRDSNGDGNFQKGEFQAMDGHVVHGWDVDEDGNIWQVSEDADGVRRFAVDGLDEQGNPVYRLEKSASYGVPGPFTKLERVKYIKGSADLWLGGYTTDRPQGKEADFSLVGTEFVHYPNFLKGGNRVAAQRIVLPYDAPRKRYVKAIDIAGGRIVASVLHATRWENSYLFDAASGNLLGRLSPGPEAGETSGLIDATHTVRAFRRPDGEYDFFIEEDAYGKIFLHRAP